MSEELKECPFCGTTTDGKAEYTDYDTKGVFRYSVSFVHKKGCPLYGESCGFFTSKEEAIEAWNKRIYSWDLLMEILGGDVGPQIVAKLREINELRRPE